MTKTSQRSYTSPLRRQQQENTRTGIIEAAAVIISEGHLMDFSIQDVADRAGVSYGTVYRHFSTREALLEALYESAADVIGLSLSLSLTTLSPEAVPSVIEKTVAVFEENAAILQAFTMALAANNLQPKSRSQRDKLVRQMIIENAPHLSPETARQAAAIICHLHSSLTWAILKQRFGLNADETVGALIWALQTLIRDLAERGKSTSMELNVTKEV